MSQTHLLGIRHHGPGSARNVRAGLQMIQPDCILIELPEQCTPLLKDVIDQALQPPLALLMYNPANLQQASFYPFVAYSPEWQAMQYAAAHNIEVRAIDLPFLFSPSANFSSRTTSLLPGIDADQEQEQDPFSRIAELDGFSDHERWWEARIERQSADVTATFDTVATLMEALRSSKTEEESTDTLLREAHMRQAIRKAQKEGYQRIAVVCGAWHVPALQVKSTTASADQSVLKSGKKTKIEVTWIPWSFERMTIRSGYGAGVRTPMWYQYLHEKGAQHAVQYWISEVARTLRSLELPVSSAHVIDAIRLAETLALMRNTSVPGIDELSEAVISVLCGGNQVLFDQVREQLVVGDVIGTVPDKFNKSPLKADFTARVSSARMKITSVETPLQLDLREAAHVKKSVLLHQLLLLNIPWGQLRQTDNRQRKGGWHEDWQVRWQPEFELQLIEKAVFGATIQQAAEASVLDALGRISELAELIGLLSKVLKAEVPQVLPPLLHQIRQISAGTTDTFLLAEVAYPLAEIQRYGSARAFDSTQLQQVLDDVLTRVCIQLPAACIQLDEESALNASKKILRLNRAVHLPGQEHHRAHWLRCLEQLSLQSLTAPACQGLAYRLLFDQQTISLDSVVAALSRAVSIGQDPYLGALWLEGFLQGNALLLIHHPPFFEVLDLWLETIPEEAFERSLPVLRRAFSAYTTSERLQVMRNVIERRGPKTAVGESASATETGLDLTEFRKQNDWLF